MWFLPGLADRRVGLFVRLHHVVADGIAGLAAVGALLDAVPGAVSPQPHPWTPAARPSRGRLFIDNVRVRVGGVARAVSTAAHPVERARRIAQGWPAVRELVAAKPGPVTSLGRLIGRGRNLALVRSSLGDMKAIAHAHDVKINDVLLAATAGGVRRLLQSRGESVEVFPRELGALGAPWAVAAAVWGAACIVTVYTHAGRAARAHFRTRTGKAGE